MEQEGTEDAEDQRGFKRMMFLKKVPSVRKIIKSIGFWSDGLWIHMQFNYVDDTDRLRPEYLHKSAEAFAFMPNWYIKFKTRIFACIVKWDMEEMIAKRGRKDRRDKRHDRKIEKIERALA